MRTGSSVLMRALGEASVDSKGISRPYSSELLPFFVSRHPNYALIQLENC
jgi:hypothetical protein